MLQKEPAILYIIATGDLTVCKFPRPEDIPTAVYFYFDDPTIRQSLKVNFSKKPDQTFWYGDLFTFWTKTHENDDMTDQYDWIIGGKSKTIKKVKVRFAFPDKKIAVIEGMVVQFDDKSIESVNMDIKKIEKSDKKQTITKCPTVLSVSYHCCNNALVGLLDINHRFGKQFTGYSESTPKHDGMVPTLTGIRGKFIERNGTRVLGFSSYQIEYHAEVN